MNEFDLIIGIHSIVHAIKNPNRFDKKLYLSEDALTELNKKHQVNKDVLLENGVEMHLYSPHKIQEEGKSLYKDLSLEYRRIPSNIFFTTSPLEIKNISWLYEELKNKKSYKILCLDQVSDVNNAAAIMRTASFYGVSSIIIPSKNTFGLSPSFYRISSGSAESVSLVQVASMPRVIDKLTELGVSFIALSEHASKDIEPESLGDKKCLILGQEETGISHAILRKVENIMSLESQGDIKSLNVSVAAAIAMEKCFK